MGLFTMRILRQLAEDYRTKKRFNGYIDYAHNDSEVKPQPPQIRKIEKHQYVEAKKQSKATVKFNPYNEQYGIPYRTILKYPSRLSGKKR